MRNYSYGKLHDTQIEFDYNGKISKKSTYDNNFCKREIYYENENIKYDMRYIKIGYTIKKSSIEYDMFGKIVTN